MFAGFKSSKTLTTCVQHVLLTLPANVRLQFNSFSSDKQSSLMFLEYKV